MIGIFQFYFPKLYRKYSHNINALLEHHSDLVVPLPGSVFAAASFNFGPMAQTYEHTDSGNKANGICPIFCSGTFDHKRGGHLILRQLKLLVEFPPGAFILIPSATLMHGNVAIEASEERESFTQYAAGGLFRWVEYGFRSWKMIEEEKDTEFIQRELATRPSRWLDSLMQFSTVSSLHSDRLCD
jgi:hypothetical protein